MRFNCTGCGECCRKLGAIKEFVNNGNEKNIPDYMVVGVKEFPYGHNEQGVCEMLDEDNKCLVYQDRPMLCNLKRIWEEWITDQTEEEWYSHNMEICNFLMRMAGTDERFHIKKAYLL